MTDRSLSTHAARAGGWPLARTVVLTLLTVLTTSALAQPVTWEVMPGVRREPTDPDRIVALGFLRGEGPAADDPAADTLVAISTNGGAFLYNPSGAAGAAGPNVNNSGDWGAWYPLCSSSGCGGPQAGVVTAAGSVMVGGVGATGHSRGTGRGRRWAINYTAYGATAFLETARAAPVGAVFAAVSDDGGTVRSLADGAPGTWVQAGTGFGFPESFGEVPPSAALPNGRILMGVWNGVTYSDDGGLSYIRSSAYGNARYIVWSFAFLPQTGHPYGGTAYAGVQNLAYGEFAGAEALRSDDGGTTWALAHHFTAAELEHPVPENADVTEVVLLAAPDGVLWAGVGHRASIPNRGGVMRSTDGGQTWARADAGFRDATGQGYRVNQLKLSRTGVLYAATERGVWRTTTAVVAGEASPVEASGVAVSVRPNPAGGRVEVVVSLAEAGPVRAVVVDGQGREVAVVLDGASAAGERVVAVDTGSWPAGVYVVTVTSRGRVASARLVVAR